MSRQGGTDERAGKPEGDSGRQGGHTERGGGSAGYKGQGQSWNGASKHAGAARGLVEMKHGGGGENTIQRGESSVRRTKRGCGEW